MAHLQLANPSARQFDSQFMVLVLQLQFIGFEHAIVWASSMQLQLGLMQSVRLHASHTC